MKTYPIDGWFDVVFWPWNKAKGKHWLIKLALIFLGMAWGVLTMPVSAILLFISAAWAFWDDLK